MSAMETRWPPDALIVQGDDDRGVIPLVRRIIYPVRPTCPAQPGEQPAKKSGLRCSRTCCRADVQSPPLNPGLIWVIGPNAVFARICRNHTPWLLSGQPPATQARPCTCDISAASPPRRHEKGTISAEIWTWRPNWDISQVVQTPQRRQLP
jgi:hypothetical protein